jgi:hypothetical protein
VSDELLRDMAWLTSGDARPHLQQAAAWPEVTAARVAELRRACTTGQSRLVIEQVALRRRARAKFAAADEMFFTPLGLEQATDEVVARYKASRMPVGSKLVDLCTGIGGDLLAMAERGATTAVDRDPIAVTVARANLDLLKRLSNSPAVLASHVELADAREVDLAGATAWHIDPDRRPIGRRTTKVELHEPALDVLEIMLRANENAAIKLAPAAELPQAWQERAELEWISRAGECRQLVAWFGAIAGTSGGRRATVLGSTATPLAVVVGTGQVAPPPVAPLARYLYEPDAAVLAARLADHLAAQMNVAAVAPSVAYWTSDTLVDEPAASAFEVVEVFPLHVKQLKPALRARNVGVLEIKKRGIDVDPQSLRQSLDLCGDEAATLLLTRVSGRGVALLARRLR